MINECIEPSNIRAICFDIFGVLVLRQRREFIESFIPSQHLKTVKDLQRDHEIGGLSTDSYYNRIAELTSTGISPTECRSRMIGERMLNSTLIDALKAFRKAQPEVGCHLLSNTGGDYLDYFGGGTNTLFDEHLTSARLRERKPHPAMFERSANILGLNTEQIVLIDDNVRNCQVARQVGMAAVHYEGPDSYSLGHSFTKI